MNKVQTCSESSQAAADLCASRQSESFHGKQHHFQTFLLCLQRQVTQNSSDRLGRVSRVIGASNSAAQAQKT